MRSFVIHGEPVAKGRPRFNRYSGRAFTPEKTINYENLVKMEYLSAYPNEKPYPKDVPLSVDIKAYFPIPSSTSKKKREKMLGEEIRHTKKPDADNIAKSCLDSILGIAYEDDSSVVDLRVSKWYSDQPRVEMVISEVDMIPLPFTEID